MSARDELFLRLTGQPPHQHPRSANQANGFLDAYRAEVLAEAADKLVLEMAPEQPGAGPGFLLALRLSTRALRRMADEAAS